ncbi:MAG TPA: branched-chain amino acid ABC transporter permease [Burkholderiales bacterium]
MNARLLLAGAVAVALLATPLFAGPFWVFVAIEVVVFALYAASFNLLFGFGGMLPFGHAAFFGLGAYSLAVLVKKAAWHALLALAVAPVVCALAAALVAFFCVRLTGIYLGMLSFSFQMLLYTVVYKWYSLTGGDDGLSGVRLEGALGTANGLYYLSLVLVAAMLGFLWLLVGSPFGKALQAAKSNPQKSAAIGVHVALHRAIAFAIAGALAGLAGALFALANQSVFPGWLNWTASAVPIVMTVLGGMHSFVGPVIGAAVYVVLQTVLTGYTEYWALILGVLVIAIVMLMPEGIVGWFARGRRG